MDIAGLIAGLAGMMFIVMLPMLVMIIAVWKVFTKAGKPGWAIFIPIYSNIVMLEIIGQPWTRLLWYFIPFYGLYLAIVDLNALSKSFGKDAGFTVGLILLGPIFWCILGFGGAQYLGPGGGSGEQPDFTPQA
jgi:hypothetical protein